MWQLLVENRDQVPQFHYVGMVYVSLSLQTENKDENLWINDAPEHMKCWYRHCHLVLIKDDTASKVRTRLGWSCQSNSPFSIFDWTASPKEKKMLLWAYHSNFNYILIGISPQVTNTGTPRARKNWHKGIPYAPCHGTELVIAAIWLVFWSSGN